MALEYKQRQQQSKRFKKFHISETSENPQLVPTLLPEIIVEILMRLPAESLVRCKSVCKSWCSLISDPHFIKSRLSLSASNDRHPHHRLIFTNLNMNSLYTCPLYDVLHDNYANALDRCSLLNQSFYNVSIVGSCNGLLCVCLGQDTLFIWNSCTRIWYRLCCGFRKCGWHVDYGFGYDESTNDYKVVGISRKSDPFSVNSENTVKIYSLKAGSWKKIGDFPHGHSLNDSGKFSNGALHWAVSASSYPWTIVAIDLADETYYEVMQPVYDKGNKDLTVGVLGGCLCVLCNYGANHADVWVMKVYGVKDSWTILVSIPYQTDPSRDRFSVPLFISNDGKVLLQLGSSLVVYDSKNCSFSKIQNFDGCFEAKIFVDNLASPSRIRWKLRQTFLS